MNRTEILIYIFPYENFFLSLVWFSVWNICIPNLLIFLELSFAFMYHVLFVFLTFFLISGKRQQLLVAAQRKARRRLHSRFSRTDRWLWRWNYDRSLLGLWFYSWFGYCCFAAVCRHNWRWGKLVVPQQKEKSERERERRQRDRERHKRKRERKERETKREIEREKRERCAKKKHLFGV